MVDKKQALQAVKVLVAKSLLFFIALLASTVVISLMASVQLTSTIRQLFDATQKVAQGSFDINVKAHSDDEVGGLARSFNLMAKEVARLMTETAEKARMANELATVKTVQETLFPEASHDFGDFQIVGHFEPASECGGDWWNYSMVGDKLFCWIGDATGHGAPAALITGAARSAAAIIETMPDMTPARAMSVMNRAIGETSKGKIMMTFFICMIDLKSGKFTYSNASHDPPYLLRVPPDGKVTRKTFVPLIEKSGPRLGDIAKAVYEDVEVQLEPGDMILMYTDGIVDLKSPTGETWGERNFLNNVAKASQAGDDASVKMEHLKTQIQAYRNNAQLLDDITLVMCQFSRNSSRGKLVA
jgi:sigma-B regulation protein RsbU (phosphoserine phosphatase)